MRFRVAAILILIGSLLPSFAGAQSADCGKSAIEHELEIRPPNEEPTPHLPLADALDPNLKATGPQAPPSAQSA